MENGEGRISRRESGDCSAPPRCPRPPVPTCTYTWKPSPIPGAGLGHSLSLRPPLPTTERKTKSSKWSSVTQPPKPGSLAGLKLPSSGQQHGQQSAAKLPKLDYHRSWVSVPSWPVDCRMLETGRRVPSPGADPQGAGEEEEERQGGDGPRVPQSPAAHPWHPCRALTPGHFLQ